MAPGRPTMHTPIIRNLEPIRLLLGGNPDLAAKNRTKASQCRGCLHNQAGIASAR